jgi:hypothetical protein
MVRKGSSIYSQEDCRLNTVIEVPVLQEKGKRQKESGPCRESNSGPPAPEAGIIPLDHMDDEDGCRRNAIRDQREFAYLTYDTESWSKYPGDRLFITIPQSVDFVMPKGIES